MSKLIKKLLLVPVIVLVFNQLSYSQVIDLQVPYHGNVDTLQLTVAKNNLSSIEFLTKNCVDNSLLRDSAMMQIDVVEYPSRKHTYIDNFVMDSSFTELSNKNFRLTFPLFDYLKPPKTYMIRLYLMDKFYNDYGKRYVILTVKN